MSIQVIEKNRGAKVPYRINGNEVCFRNSLTINVAAYEVEDDNIIRIFTDRMGCLLCTASEDYCCIAEICIPGKEFVSDQKAVYEGDLPVVTKTQVPFQIEKCTLILWAME